MPYGSCVTATALLAVLAVVLTREPTHAALLATAAIFAGLIASYALVLTTGFPLLHPRGGSGRGGRSLHQGDRSHRTRARREPAAATVPRTHPRTTERNPG
jgi:hypothetical protein